MKKTLTAALTTALVVGAASTTFAAANPFSDVPADHWAYDAVAQLADDGIIEGYGDGTYRGQNEITRYEMAQMVAKAMAKEDQVNAQQKAMIDRLAAEFSEELNNLGVRVSNLEDRIDNVKWTGELRYTYEKKGGNGAQAYDEVGTDNDLLFRLEPTATVNDHWKVKARLDATWNPEKDSAEGKDAHVKLKRAYAAGHYGITDINAGLIPYFSEQGVVYDENLSGASITVGADQKLAGTFVAGNVNMNRTAGKWYDDVTNPLNPEWKGLDTDRATLLGLNLTWKATDSFTLAGEYYHLKAHGQYRDYNAPATNNDSNAQNIWGIGATYTFDKNVRLNGGYWKNQDFDDTTYAHKNKGAADHAWNVELGYKGAEPENMHSFGLYAAYRYLGHGATLAPTFDGAAWGEKGWEVGGNYTFAKNIVGSVLYFDGHKIDLDNNNRVKKGWARLEYLF
ncbi:S-layer homology domain-containing protein [Selenomonas sputigena]|uniref:S-layer homology domain-containing protein n=1 Tax=Selenomonas sputigena TaxID=69823 RepID=UPI00223020E0|nr:S-layer homology domain-containing protein [Selenomonas sputigena]UZD42663.1 S-layer homology domain-containing protein [Selenomonas sputigena]